MSHFTLQRRKTLADMKEQGHKYSEISEVISKSKSSISDELKRNSVSGIYNPYQAHAKAEERWHNKGKRTKLELNPELRLHVIMKLEEDWSPEQIASELKKMAQGKTIISHETIYLFIYSEEGIKLKLWKHLRHRKKPKRVPWGTRKSRKPIIPNRVSIHERPEYVNERAEFGHWEGDLMIFSNIKIVLAVFVERMTRRTVALLNDNKTAAEMEMAFHELISTAGQVNVKSITLDNGTENVCHQKIREAYDEESLTTYFCDPYASWQKGSVENMNKLLRQYLPRKIDESLLTQDYVDKVIEKLNNRPRKCLSYSTPLKQFSLRSV